MKKILGLFLSLLIPVIALAQNQGDNTPLGAGGTKILCNANEALVNTVSADGKLNYVSCSKSGGMLTVPVGASVTTSINTATLNTAVTISTLGAAQACFSWQGSIATGTGAFEVTQDGTNWVTAEVFQPRAIDAFYSLSGTTSLASTANYCVASVSSVVSARLRVSIVGTGTLPVTATTVPATNMQRIFWINPGTTSTAFGKAEEGTPANGDVGIMTLNKVLATPVAQTADGKFGNPILNDINAQYVDGVRRGATWTAANPSMTTATSTQIAGANAARRYLLVQNNSAANICVSTTGATLTAIVPSSTNVCITIAAGASWISPPNACPVTNITAYQTSGGTITSVSVIEGF